MSKATDDLIGRIEGAAAALSGVKSKLSPLPAAPVPPDLPQPPPPQVTQEDFAFAKKVIADMKGQLESLEAEVAKESKVPEAAGEAGEHKSKSKA